MNSSFFSHFNTITPTYIHPYTHMYIQRPTTTNTNTLSKKIPKQRLRSGQLTLACVLYITEQNSEPNKIIESKRPTQIQNRIIRPRQTRLRLVKKTPGSDLGISDPDSVQISEYQTQTYSLPFPNLSLSSCNPTQIQNKMQTKTRLLF
jgi:hypothetical protein